MEWIKLSSPTTYTGMMQIVLIDVNKVMFQELEFSICASWRDNACFLETVHVNVHNVQNSDRIQIYLQGVCGS